ncbi:hypothetical protein F5884DRAFT_807828 [Xylogone sp. PMI_703]|nr:hypothetical protein F5884DRAFT_807828 [Xylogone sp. PMI_703]
MNSSRSGFPDLMSRIADSLTVAIRNDDPRGAEAHGQSYFAETIVDISWPWMSLSFALLLLSLIFLVAIMLKTERRNGHLWKDDMIATMFHGLNLRDLKLYQPLERIGKMNQVAQNLYVEMQDDNGVGDTTSIINIRK